MGKIGIIGNLFCMSIMMICAQYVCAQGSVDISIRDMNGRKAMRLIAGQPFVLHVIMHDIDTNTIRISIQQSHDISFRRTSVQMHSINGKKSTTHMYAARIDERGSYVIGPVIIDDGNCQYISNSIRIDVTDTPDASDIRGEKVMLHMLSSKQAYVGESVPFCLRFYYPHEGIHPERLVQPSISNSNQSQVEGPFAGSEIFDGATYDYYEWRWDLIFEKTGTYAIPSYTMEYTDRSQRSNRFGFFTSFFNDFGGTKHVTSNTTECVIMPVPAHEQSSGFVGVVHEYTSSLDHAYTSVGQAIVLTLTLQCDHHSATLQQPLLHDMPRALKYYESKVSRDSNQTTTTICFEYIIQPLEQGEWEIPSQPYIYFDTKLGEYRTAWTDPVYLAVSQGTQNQTLVSHDATNQTSYAALPSSIDSETIKPLHEMGPWSYEHDLKIIPWLFFWLLMMMPVGYSVCSYCYNRWRAAYDATLIERRSRYALKYARDHVKRIQRTGNLAELPIVFKRFFADALKMPFESITETSIQEYLKEKSVSLDVQKQWELFWNAIHMYAFAEIHAPHVIKNELYNSVFKWLDTLNELL